MRGSSRGAAASVQEAFDAVLTGTGDRIALGEDLFSVSAVIEANPSLRRALADPSRDGAAKRVLAQRLFGGRVSAEATELLGATAAGRWSREGDFADTVESLGVQAVLAQAEREGRIDAVEDELFRFERIVAGDPDLRDTLSLRNTDIEGKAALVRGLLEGKAQPETIRLAEQAVTSPRGRRLDRVLESYLDLAATRREQLSALVTVAAPLTEQQQARLRTALERIYTKSVVLHIVIDPNVVGGIRVQVGDEVVDGTVLRRLDEARRHITGA
ncbi:F0F1 ATP synthase subunit delta [Nostocoides sp. F2B08]|uniref:F0F1 ATP synthase subunit delta n=1 Tax=Nostocoides sp. F2B08 TaxID=2653936 RepID=UPI001263D456|nr:F0F1 ATP synthase subunit delta [Tetrasphaera sp. F2B08]KAB7746161.1 F0F1 ATP synthase subunit delta [Tetrasphaera sp. F2B08]